MFYTWGETSLNKHDPGFGKEVEWDIPLLDGYTYTFLKNSSSDPGSHHFNGIENPDGIQRIKAFSPDAILIYGWAYKSHLKILRYFKGKTSVWFRGDSNLENFSIGLRSFTRYIWLRWVYSHIDKALYVGAANKRYFKTFGVPNNQLVFAPHAIDNERFAQPRDPETKGLREGLNVKENEILILFAGKFEPKKDPELLLTAFSDLNKSDVHLLFIGDGILKQKLEETSKNIPNKKNVHFLDFQNQNKMPVFYQACDLFCLPSKGPGETWGLAVNEAMACGKALLVSNKVGCAEDLVMEGYNGAIFKHSSVLDLIEKLKMLTNDSEGLKKMGQNSRTIIEEWTIEKQAIIIETCIKLTAK